MAPSDLFGLDAPPPEEGLPEPPPPEGPGLFGDPVPPAPAPMTIPPAAPAPAAPYRVLARKYRPERLDDLIGQDTLVRTLRNAFAQGRVAHAFMLTGVRGVGKTTTARIIARALNCVGPDGRGGPTADPCGACPECRAIAAGRHPDVVELDAASNNGVANVREITDAVRFRPIQGRRKVWVLDEVHMLSTAAWNALLKTLEEPPGDTAFVFATTELRRVPVTVLSRCQTFHLRRVPQDALRAHFGRICGLEEVGIEPEALAMLARAADGSVRDGLSLLDQAIALAGPAGAGGRDAAVPAGGGAGAGAEAVVAAATVRDMLGLADRALALDLLEAALRGDLPRALALHDDAHAAGVDPATLLTDLLALAHALTRLRAAPTLRDDPSLPEAERTRGAALADALSVPVLARAWQMLLKGLAEVHEAPDRRAAAEMVLIRLAHVATLPTPGELVRRLSAEGGAGTATGGTVAGAMAGAGTHAPPGGAPAAGGGPGGGSGGLRAVAGGGPVVVAVPAAAPEPDRSPPPVALDTFRAVVMLAATHRRAMLHAHLVHSVHPVRFAPGRIELRVLPDAPRDLAAQLSALLAEATGERWTVALSNAEGEPTLAAQGRAAEAGRRAEAAGHPLVRAILEAFPGAEIGAVRDPGSDAYGLPPAVAAAVGPAPSSAPDPGMDAMPDFAPPEAEPAWDDDQPPED